MITAPLTSKAYADNESQETKLICGAVSSKWAKGTGGPSGDERQNLLTHALSAEGADASEDGTGRRTPLVVAATLNSGGNSGGFRSEPGEHLVAFGWNKSASQTMRIDESTVEAIQSTPSSQPAIAFSSKDSGADAGPISPTLRSMNFDKSHISGGGQVAVAFESRVARNGRGAPSGIVPPLKAESGQTGKGDSAPLTAGTFGVRRLTPRECERLQSFPDDFTRWDSEGKEVSDSARYRMLGNAVCVNVAEWIGKRILALS